MTRANCPIPKGPKPLAISAAVTALVNKLATPGNTDTTTSSIALRDSKMTFWGSAITDLNDRMILLMWFAYKFGFDQVAWNIPQTSNLYGLPFANGGPNWRCEICLQSDGYPCHIPCAVNAWVHPHAISQRGLPASKSLPLRCFYPFREAEVFGLLGEQVSNCENIGPPCRVAFTRAHSFI
jgi:hypothetical protein